MLRNVKAKRTVFIAAAALVCLAVVLFAAFGSRSAAVEPEASVATAQLGLAKAGADADLQTASGEETVISEEWIAVDAAPYTVEFRDYALTLEACEVSKELCGQPKTDVSYFKGFETDEDGKILSRHSYVHVTFRQKNENDEKQIAGINNSCVFVAPAGSETWTKFAEPSVMNRKPEDQNSPDYYIWSFNPGEEQQFTVTYVLPDEYLTEDYDLYYAFRPLGISENVPLENGNVKLRFDARFLLLDSICSGSFPVEISEEELLPEAPEVPEETPPPYVPYEEKTGDFAQLSAPQSEPFAIGDAYMAVIEDARFATDEETQRFLSNFEVETGKDYRAKSVVVTITVTKNEEVQNRAEITALELNVCGYQSGFSKNGYLKLNEDPSTELSAGESKTFRIPYVMWDVSFSGEEWDTLAQQEFCLVCPYGNMKYSSSNETLRIPLTLQ